MSIIKSITAAAVVASGLVFSAPASALPAAPAPAAVQADNASLVEVRDRDRRWGHDRHRRHWHGRRHSRHHWHRPPPRRICQTVWVKRWTHWGSQLVPVQSCHRPRRW